MSVFDPPSREQAAKASELAARQSVQSSLYVRLKKLYPSTSGDVAWALIRAATPEHPLSESAIRDLVALDAHDFYALVLVARKTRAAARNDAWRELADAVLAALESADAERNDAIKRATEVCRCGLVGDHSPEECRAARKATMAAAGVQA